MKCPVCTIEMDRHDRHGVTIDHCPTCGGVWLDKGELDHLIAAVRPAVTLRDPDPAPARQDRLRPEPVRPEPARKTRYGPRPGAKPQRHGDEPRDKTRKPGQAQRYRGRYSGRERIKDILEEIFDFD